MWLEVMHQFCTAQLKTIAPTQLAHDNSSVVQIEPALNLCEGEVIVLVDQCPTLLVCGQCVCGVHFGFFLCLVCQIDCVD